MRELLPASGLAQCYLGLETLSDQEGRAVGLAWLREAWRDRVMTCGSIILGLPGDSKESITHTIKTLQQPRYTDGLAAHVLRFM